MTDQGLQDLAEQLDVLQKRFAEDRYMLILIQGLNALRLYITDERADAHPEAFSLVHSFYEGLRLLAENKDLDAGQRRRVLTEKVNSLNNLKLLVVNRAKAVEPAQEKPDILPETGLAAKTMPPPVEPVADADNVFEEEPEEGEVAPALADIMAEETGNVAEETEAGAAEAPAELEEKIDFFFGEEGGTPKP